jgi:hypothetical protein
MSPFPRLDHPSSRTLLDGNNEDDIFLRSAIIEKARKVEPVPKNEKSKMQAYIVNFLIRIM